MIMRKVNHAEPSGWNWRWNVALECGHVLRDVYANKDKPPPSRKRCKECELIADFAKSNPADYNAIVRMLNHVPPDDRPQVLTSWVAQATNAAVMAKRCGGLDMHLALDLEVPPFERYPLLSAIMRETDEDEGGTAA